jgi:hypothetical protein
MPPGAAVTRPASRGAEAQGGLDPRRPATSFHSYGLFTTLHRVVDAVQFPF